MKYSFIIPMYNEVKDISHTVDRCLHQKTGDYSWEILLIDDGSVDGTYDYCQKMYSSFPNIRILKNNTNKGVSYTRNHGVDVATGDVVIFLNADELVNEDFLEKINIHYQNNADYLFPLSRVYNRDTLYGCFRDCYRLKKYNRPNMFMWSQGFSCKKECFLAVGGFDSRYPGCGGEDWDFVSKLDLLFLNRVVDWNITVQHTVPEKLNHILWHMYNRGRGSSYYDFIYKKVNPHKYLAKEWGIIFLLLFLSWIIDWKLIPVYLVYCFCKSLISANKLRTGYESPKYSIIIMYFMDKVIRKIGYDINAWKLTLRGTHYE